MTDPCGGRGNFILDSQLRHKFSFSNTVYSVLDLKNKNVTSYFHIIKDLTDQF